MAQEKSNAIFQFKADKQLSITKTQQLINALNLAIQLGELKPGDLLPSVNQLSTSGDVSRDTVFKVYREMVRRGVIESAPQHGYFVASDRNKIMLFLDTYSSFKDTLYHNFRAQLPENYGVDLFFHHYNSRVFESIILDNIGQYSMYVVMNFDHEMLGDTLRKIDPNKLLIFDWGRFDKKGYSYVCQDFDKAVYNSLVSGLQRIRTYEEFLLIFPTETHHPKETVDAFKRFCHDYNIKSRVVNSFEVIESFNNKLFFVIDELDLVKIIKITSLNSLVLGKDVGIISYNDTPMKEVVGNGITVISTDFALMGKMAADFVLHKQKLQFIVPTTLTERGSL
ncbi:MAG: GntR family transcriptional regulator [Bacteroidota bacterium]|nr:GntR family transcriptional regulator [Bacteroidota bacterium]